MLEGGKDWRSEKPESRRSRGTREHRADYRPEGLKTTEFEMSRLECSTGSTLWGTTFNLINGKILRVAD